MSTPSIEYVEVENLRLDPRNPRLRDEQHNLMQDELLDAMSDWGLDELAISIIENGFWPQEALIVTHEKLTPKDKAQSLIVIEGNRRLAAVLRLLAAYDGEPTTKKWKTYATGLKKATANSLRRLPTIYVNSRSDVDAFLGFRHVTGIKQWEPHEKAAFIAKLVDSGLSYTDVMRKIGSKTPSVRQNYIAQKLFRQLSDIDGIDAERIRSKFSVLFLSLRSAGTQAYLGIDIEADPAAAAKPLKPKFQENARRFARWMFGDQRHEPLVTDSRHTDQFGKALESAEARSYLERTENPRLEVAFRLSGGDREELIRHIERASDELEEALGIVQHHTKNNDVVRAAQRLYKDVAALRAHIPEMDS